MEYSIDLIKNEIKRETNEVFTIKKNSLNLDDNINLLLDVIRIPIKDDSLKLNGITSLMLNSFNKLLVEGVKNSDRETFFSSFAKAEQLFRKISYLIDSTNYVNIEQKGFMGFINELELNPNNVHLDNVDLKTIEGDVNYIDHLCRVYRYRNNDSHKITELSNKEFGQLVQSFLVIYIYAVFKHRKVLSNNIANTSTIDEPSFYDYCNQIIETFKERISRFIHLTSKENINLSGSYVLEFKLNHKEGDDEEIGRSGTVELLRKSKIHEKRMIIWGEAGMGKSTTLEYLAYKDALKRKSDISSNIPVYVSLGLLTDSSISIEDYIYKKLGINSVLGKELLKSGRINLFLDGINEIPKDSNNMLITKRQREIDYLLNEYKNTFIIISNRPQQINQFASVPVFFIQKMDDIQIKDFVNRYSGGDRNIEDKINNAISNDVRLKRIIKTPLMLSRLIEIIKTDGEIPSNEGLIIDRFIKSLYKREVIEKKDAQFNDRQIHKLLAYLGSYSIESKGTNSGLSENEVLNSFIKCKKEYNFEIDLDYVFDISCQLNILERNEGKYVFAHQSYQDYFNSEYERIILGE